MLSVRAAKPQAKFQEYRMSDTLFAKIIRREIPADIVFEDEHVLAFRDIQPQAPVHVVVVPRKPIPRVGLAAAADEALLGHLLLTAAAVARQTSAAVASISERK
jgi:histidine triad (HIT) family protein